MRKILLASALALCFTSVFAQSAIDPPLTPQEQAMVAQMKAQWKQQGMGEMTDQQVAVMVKRMRDMRLQMMGAMAGMRAAGAAAMPPPPTVANPPLAPAAAAPQAIAPPTVAAPQPAAATPSASDLSAQIAARNGSNKFTLFEPRGDGFTFDGQPYIDADGRIGKIGADAATGWVTYLVNTTPGHFLVKHQNVHSSLPPLLIGQVDLQNGYASFRGVDGQTAGGKYVIPTSNGVLVVRDESVVNYDLGKGLRPIALPQGFAVAQYQHGDVAGTGYVLLERIDNDPRNPVKAAADIGRLVGDLFGAKDTTYDYALYGLDNQAVVPINLSTRDKSVGQGTNCHRKNAFVNKCAGWQEHDSLWDNFGQPNLSHYFWALTWQKTRYGAVAVAEENTLRDVNVITLENGKRYNAFHRGLGINGFHTTPTADGGLRVTARIVFKDEELADVGSLFAGGGAAPAAPAQPQ